MNKAIAAIICAAALSGCAEKQISELSYAERKKLALGFIETCRAQGISVDSPEMEACFYAEAERETTRREKSAEQLEEFGDALSAGAASYSNSVNSAPRYQPAYRQPISCTSSSLGGYTRTNCY